MIYLGCWTSSTGLLRNRSSPRVRARDCPVCKASQPSLGTYPEAFAGMARDRPLDGAYRGAAGSSGLRTAPSHAALLMYSSVSRTRLSISESQYSLQKHSLRSLPIRSRKCSYKRRSRFGTNLQGCPQSRPKTLLLGQTACGFPACFCNPVVAAGPCPRAPGTEVRYPTVSTRALTSASSRSRSPRRVLPRR